MPAHVPRSLYSYISVSLLLCLLYLLPPLVSPLLEVRTSHASQLDLRGACWLRPALLALRALLWRVWCTDSDHISSSSDDSSCDSSYNSNGNSNHSPQTTTANTETGQRHGPRQGQRLGQRLGQGQGQDRRGRELACLSACTPVCLTSARTSVCPCVLL